VPFAGARYEQRSQYRLDRHASLALVDILSCGRSARGERWAFSRYAIRTRIEREGRIVADDALVLDARERDLARSMGRFEAFATVFLFGPALASTREGALTRAREAAPRRGELLVSASPIGDDGACVRVGASSLSWGT
jgi:urease accessory protein